MCIVFKKYIYTYVCVMTIRYDKHGWNWNHPTRDISDCQNPTFNSLNQASAPPLSHPPTGSTYPPVSENGKGQKRSGKTDGNYVYIYIHYHTSYLLISINHRTMKKKFRDWLTVYFPTTYHNMQYSKVQMFRLLAFSWISAWRHDAFTEGTPVMGPSPTTFCQLGVQCATPTKSLLK